MTKTTWYRRNIGNESVAKAKGVLKSGPMSTHALAAFLGVSPGAARSALARLGAVEWRRVYTGKRGRPVVLWALP